MNKQNINSRNWNNGKTFEELQDDILEDEVMKSLLTGDMGVA